MLLIRPLHIPITYIWLPVNPFSLLPSIPIPELRFDFFLQQFLQTGPAPDSVLDLEQVYGAVGLQVATHPDDGYQNRTALQTVAADAMPNALQVYPNPTGDVLNVGYPALKGVGQVRVYEVTGRLVQQQSIAVGSSLKQLEVKGLVPGLYLVELLTGEGTALRKTFIKH